MNATQTGPKKNHYEIRHTVVLLVVQLLLVELVITGLHIGVDEIFLAHRFHDTVVAGISGKVRELLFFHLLTTIGVIYFVLRRVTSYYLITDTEITYQQGIVTTTSNAYDISGIQEIDTAQGLWGRLFGYGDILIENPLLSSTIQLTNIPSPAAYARVIKSMHTQIRSTHGHEQIIPLQKLSQPASL